LNDKAIEISDDAGVDDAAAELVDAVVVVDGVATEAVKPTCAFDGLAIGAAGTIESRAGAGVKGVDNKSTATVGSSEYHPRYISIINLSKVEEEFNEPPQRGTLFLIKSSAARKANVGVAGCT
jgi:hypothetical protein